MNGPISAKVSPPVLSEILHRERPFSIIDGLFNRPILWVTGPPGSGKTTLVASYLDSRKLPHLWYKVDVSDSDIATFFYYMGLALREFTRKNKWGNKKPLPLLTPEYLDGINAFTRTYFEELYNNLCHSQKTKRKTKVIVLDDYQTVSDKARFHSIIAEGLSLMPESIRAVIISRSEPPPIYTKFRTQRAMSFIGWDDIRFTKDETADFFKSQGKNRISGKGIVKIYEECNGWISGAILLSESDKVNKQEIFPTSLPSYEGVFDYFASELFDKFDPDTREFLLRTSFLNHISPPVIDRLTEIKNSEVILKGLYKNNCFTSRYLLDTFVYEYHPLFKRFLRNRAETIYGHDEVTKIKNKTAGILKEEGLYEEALSLLKESGHWSDFVRLLVSEAPVIASQGRIETLFNLLSDIPDEIIKDSPSCLYWMGISGMPFDTYKSRELFGRAFEGFAKRKDIDGALLSWAGVIETIFFERGDFSRMDKWIKDFNEFADNSINFSYPEIEISVIRGMIETILSRTPYNKDSERWLKRAIELVESDISPDNKLSIANTLHLYLVYTGDYITASAIFDSLQQTINPETLSPISTIRWHLIRAVHAHLVTVSIDDCLKSVDLGLEIAERTGIHLLDIPLYQTGAYASLIIGNYQRTEDYLKRMKPFIKPFSYFDIGNCNSIKLSIALMKKNYFAAFKEALNTLRMAFKSESPIPIFLTRIGIAQALISLGRLKMASEHIKKADLMISKIKKTETYFLPLLTKAYLGIRKRDPLTIEVIREAFKIGSSQYCLNTLHWNPSMMSQLCAIALCYEIEVDYVKELIFKRDLRPPDEESIKEISFLVTMSDIHKNWPYPLKISTFGGFEVKVYDRPLKVSGKPPMKALALLKALISLGGRDVPIHTVMDVLWPESTGDKANNSLKFTLHELRKLLGNERFLTLKEEMLSLNHDFCNLDLWNLQEIMKEIEVILIDKDNISAVISLLEDVFDLYKGDFLKGEEITCVISMRERIKSKFIRLIYRLCDCYETINAYEKAITACEKALDIDELQEEFYRRLMLYNLKLGRRAEAIRSYERCKTILSKTLCIEPSEETEAVLKKIKS